MPDLSEQLRNWSQSLADSAAPTTIEMVTSSRSEPRNSHLNRRLLAIAASAAFVVAGIVALAARSDGGPDRISPAIEVPGTTDGTTSASTRPERTVTGPASTSESPTTTPAPSENGFDIASVFGDVSADALAVTDNGDVVAPAGSQLLVRGPDGEVATIELPDGIVVSQAWVGTDEIAVAWGTDRGAEVDLRTGQIVTSLTRSDETWTRTEPSPASSYSVNVGRPTNPLGLGLLIDADTQLPTVEGAGGFEVIYDQSQQWTIGRPAEGSAFVDEITALPGGAYLLTMQSIAADPTIPADVYPFVLRADGSIETLDPITTGPTQAVDAQAGPDGLTVLTVDTTTATIEKTPIPDSP